MINDAAWLISIFGTGVALMLIAGFYCVLATRSLIRVFIGVEILAKAMTLLLIISGYLTGKTSLAQTLAITLIIVEVAVLVVAISIILCLYRHDSEIDAAALRKLKG
jgi:NADH:ubiquinone oxidoreductase subunit K